MSVPEIEIVGGSPVASTQDTSPATNIPEYGAIRPKRSDGSGQQIWEILVYPIPNGSLELNYRYTSVPSPLSETNPFPLGGRQHSETILQSCLAVAEDREKGGPGPAYSKYLERLRASVEIDKSLSVTDDTMTWATEADNVGNTLQSLAGEHMGFGQNPRAWTENQRQIVLEAMRQGLRRFYVPVPVLGRRDSHVWSFLFPLESMTLKAGQWRYDLPSDFGGIDSPITYNAGDNVIHPSIEVIGEHQIRRLLEQTTQASGRPTKAGFGQKAGATENSGYEIMFWPVPDGDYTLNYRYRVSPGQDVSVIHGGDAHFQTILEAIKAAADVIQRKRQRPHEALFQERLVASVLYDQQLAAPAKMGYNRDGSNSATGDIFDDQHRSGFGESGVGYNGRFYT
ncbi:MAG: hypothetical protein AAF745_00205 [Planctomycetota bacterium]